MRMRKKAKEDQKYDGRWSQEQWVGKEQCEKRTGDRSGKLETYEKATL